MNEWKEVKSASEIQRASHQQYRVNGHEKNGTNNQKYTLSDALAAFGYGHKVEVRNER